MSDNIDEELMHLAETTPSKYRLMTITHKETGAKIVVDQSLDAIAPPDVGNSLLNEFIKINNVLSGKPYDGRFDNGTIFEVGELIIDFGDVSGAMAYKWIMSYVVFLLGALSEKGVLKQTNKGTV